MKNKSLKSMKFIFISLMTVKNAICEMPTFDRLSSVVFIENSSVTAINQEETLGNFSKDDVAKFAERADYAYKIAKNQVVPQKSIKTFKSDDSNLYNYYMGDNSGYVTTQSDGKIIVSFKGTTSIANLLTDGYCIWKTKNGGRYHRGIFNAYESIQPALLKILTDIAAEQKTELKDVLSKTIFTGHSLGGGMALIAADLLRREGFDVFGVVSFAAPKVMDDTSVDDYDKVLGSKTVAVEQAGDPIPFLNPFTYFYNQVGCVLKIPFETQIVHHKMQGYINVLNSLTYNATLQATTFFSYLRGSKTYKFKDSKQEKASSTTSLFGKAIRYFSGFSPF